MAPHSRPRVTIAEDPSSVPGTYIKRFELTHMRKPTHRNTHILKKKKPKKPPQQHTIKMQQIAVGEIFNILL